MSGAGRDVRTKTPELGPCPQCGRTQLQLARMQGRGIRVGFLPSAGDNVSWAELKKDHAPGCYWWETRGFRTLTWTNAKEEER